MSIDDVRDAGFAEASLPRSNGAPVFAAPWQARAHAIESAGRLATEVPMRTARAAARLLAALPELVEKGNPNALSDAGAAALMLSAAAEGALLNVGINLPGISDAAFVEDMRREAAAIQAETRRLCAQVVADVAKRI